MNLSNTHFLDGYYEYSAIFFFLMAIQREILTFLFTTLSYCCRIFGAPKDHEDNRAEYELKLSRVIVNIAF